MSKKKLISKGKNKSIKNKYTKGGARKYQAGGSKYAGGDMYGSNNIPNAYNPTSASLSYTQTDPALTKSLLSQQEELGDTADLSKINEKAKQATAKVDSAMGSMPTTLKKIGKLGEKAGLIDSVLPAGQEAYSKGAEELSHLAPIPGVDQGMNLATNANRAGTIGKGVQAFKGAKDAGSTGAQALKIGTTAAGWAGPQAVGTAASLVGKGIEKKFDDDDVTTMNAGETAGTLLKGAGYGASAVGAAGAAGLIGTAAAGTTAAAGAGVAGTLATVGATNIWNPVGWGALIAAAGAGAYGLIKRGKGRRDVAEKEGKHQRKQNAIGKKLASEETSALEVEGYDFGNNYSLPGAVGSERRQRRTGGAYQTGGQVVPGGEVVPIPGSDAVEFKGKTHAEGGIKLDASTEVEDKETMDKVSMKGKGKQDYFFSDYLKYKGGKSYASEHKRILAQGGSQEAIDALAHSQEADAGRNPEDVQVAQTGGPKTIEELHSREQIFYNGLQNAKDTQRKYTADGKNMSFMQRLDRQLGHSDLGVTSPFNKEMDHTRRELTQYDEAQRDAGKGVPFTKMQNGGFETAEEEYDALNLIETQQNPNFFTRAKNFASEKIGNYRDGKSDRQLKRAINSIDKDVPTSALLAGAGQMIPALYAFNHKEASPEQVGKAGRVVAPDLDRVNFNSERSQAASDSRARSKMISNSGAGPGGIAAMMASHAAKSKQDMQIASAESRANAAISSQEAQMRMSASSQNVANDLRVDTMNTQINEAQRIAEENAKKEALDVGFKNIAGINSDVLAYKASEREARAYGAHGIYERDKLRNSLRGKTNPNTGKVYTNAEIAQLVTQLNVKEE